MESEKFPNARTSLYKVTSHIITVLFCLAAVRITDEHTHPEACCCLCLRFCRHECELRAEAEPELLYVVVLQISLW